MKKNIIYTGLATFLLVLSSCENQENEFPDFDYQTVYFANQYAMRIVELGEDEHVDNSMDNQHKVIINATIGGMYENGKDRVIDFEVDNSLCEHLYFKGTDIPVLPMPADYYQLASSRIVIPSGDIQGGVEVQLTDAFFEDEKALDNNYVIPLVMTGMQDSDSILQGKPATGVDNPNRVLSEDWSIQPKDYVFYGVKYVNPWHGVYLRRGVDNKTIGGVSSAVVRHTQYVEDGEVVNAGTASLREVILPLTTQDASGTNVSYNLSLTFAEDGSCVIGSASDQFVIAGSGKFVSKGEKNSVGGKDRDAIYLDYTVDFIDRDMTYATKDTLVLRERGVYGAGTFEAEVK